MPLYLLWSPGPVISWAIFNDITCWRYIIGKNSKPWKLGINMPNFIIITVAADALAPLGARASAGAVMSRFRSYINIGPAVEIWWELWICAKHTWPNCLGGWAIYLLKLSKSVFTDICVHQETKLFLCIFCEIPWSPTIRASAVTVWNRVILC